MSSVGPKHETSESNAQISSEAPTPAWDLEKNIESVEASAKPEARPITGVRVSRK
jgi:hypothetical protein